MTHTPLYKVPGTSSRFNSYGTTQFQDSVVCGFFLFDKYVWSPVALEKLPFRSIEQNGFVDDRGEERMIPRLEKITVLCV